MKKRQKKYKKKYNVYSAWNYEQEIEDLNKASENGWQLVCGKSFSHKYKYNPEVRYRYQLDCQPDLNDEQGRYLETYREQGWEYISKTFNGWYYFRKPYDPTLPEEQYRIYTDTSSLKQMHNRSIRYIVPAILLELILLIAHGVRFALRPTLPSLLFTLTFTIILLVLGRGIWLLKRQSKVFKSKKDCVFMALYLITIFGCVFTGATLLSFRPAYSNAFFRAETYSKIPAEIENAVMLFPMESVYPDNYYLDLSIQAETPVCFSILNEQNKAVYTVTTADFEEERIKFKLEKGSYAVYLSDFAGGQIDVTYSIK